MNSRKRIILLLTAAITVILVLTITKSSTIYDKFSPEVDCPKRLNEILTNETAGNDGPFSLDSAMLSYMKVNHIHGLSLAVVRNDSLLFAKGYGEADKSVPMEPGTLFRIASVSKLITAAGIMALVDRGRLSLDETVLGPQGILYKYQISDPAYEKITVEDLLRHEGGFRYSVDDPLFSTRKQIIQNGWKEVPDADMLINSALKQRLPVPHGTEAHYSNLGYLLLSRIIEARTGEDYDTWMQKNVLVPAGCYDMHIAGNFYKDKLPNETRYYVQSEEKAVDCFDNSGRKVERCYGENDIPTLSGAGAWMASAPELARFIASIDGNPLVPDIITTDSFLNMTEDMGDDRFSLGWNGTSYDGEWSRTGSFAGTNALIKRFPEGDIWVLIANTSTRRGSRQSNYMAKLIRECHESYIEALPAQNLFN